LIIDVSIQIWTLCNGTSFNHRCVYTNLKIAQLDIVQSFRCVYTDLNSCNGSDTNVSRYTDLAVSNRLTANLRCVYTDLNTVTNHHLFTGVSIQMWTISQRSSASHSVVSINIWTLWNKSPFGCKLTHTKPTYTWVKSTQSWSSHPKIY